MSTIWGIDAATLTAFDKAYWLSQPTPVQQLQFLDDSQGARSALALQLAGQGYFIDVPIQVWNFDPYMTMLQRQVDGYTTYPDALNKQTRPVDTNIADYPPFNLPTPPAPTPNSLVGASMNQAYTNLESAFNGWEMFNSNPGTNNSSISAGKSYSGDPRGTFYKLVNQTPFGVQIFWVLKP